MYHSIIATIIICIIFEILLAELAMSLAALVRPWHLRAKKGCLQGRQVYSSSASPPQAPRDFPDERIGARRPLIPHREFPACWAQIDQY